MQVLRALAVAVFVAGVTLLIIGFTANDGADPPATPEPFEPFTVAPSTPPPSATEAAEPTPTPFEGAVARMRIPRFNVDAGIEILGILPDNTLDSPHDPHNVGWYDVYGDRPGWGGNALFSAHVDYWPDILGPFHQLSKTNAGDEVVVVMADGTEYRYRVISKQRYKVEDIKMGEIRDAKDKPAGAEWITLITCGGDFEPISPEGWGVYKSRDVVVAERVS